MGKIIKDTIHANGIDIGIYTQDFENEFISLTDIARYKSDDPTAVIQNWMRNRDVIEFLGLWERLHNPDFKPLEFEGFKKQAGANAFTMSPKKWIEATDAIGIVSKAGRYGGTYAHSDIAMSFATWISPEFQLYIMKDYRRLKTDENSRMSLNWNLNREISKLNYRIHTDAIKENLIPPELTPAQVAYTYANEADMLNVVLFGKTAKQWKDENPTAKGNMRDAATLNQLLVLANLESYNAVLINQDKNQKERMELLRMLTVQQLQTLETVSLNNLPKLEVESNKKQVKSDGCKILESPETVVNYYDSDFDYYEEEGIRQQVSGACANIERVLRDKEAIYDITPREFEELVAEVFSQQGYNVEITPATRDGGCDIIATKEISGIPYMILIECKKYSARHKVDVQLVRSLLGVQSDRKANKAILVTSSLFTRDARQFAERQEHLISLVDINDLMDMMRNAR